MNEYQYAVWLGYQDSMAELGIASTELIAEGNDIAWILDYARKLVQHIHITQAIYITTCQDTVRGVEDIPLLKLVRS